MDDLTMTEFKRLYKEAGEVAYTHDEFLRLIFNAAVKLHSGEWLNSYLPPVALEATMGQNMGETPPSPEIPTKSVE